MTTNKKVAIMLANGFEEIEALTVVDVLRRANIDCDTVSIHEELVESCHGVQVKSDKHIDNIDKDSYDMIVLPGGLPGADYLRDCAELISWIQDFSKNSNKYIAAICAAPQVLAKAGIEKGRKVTSYPGNIFREILKDANYIEDLVVVDGNIITSRGPATAMSFAYKLVDILDGNSEALKSGMLYNMISKEN